MFGINFRPRTKSNVSTNVKQPTAVSFYIFILILRVQLQITLSTHVYLLI